MDPLLLPVHVMFRTTHASQSFHMLDAALEHTVAVDTETRRATYPLSHHSDHMTVHVPRGVCYMLQSQGHMSHHPDLCTDTTPLVGLHWSYHSPTVCLQPWTVHCHTATGRQSLVRSPTHCLPSLHLDCDTTLFYRHARQLSCATEKYVSAAGCAAGYAAGYAPDIPAQPSRLGFSEILRYKPGILRSWTNRGWSSAPISCAVSCNGEKHETTRMSA